jgi:Immunoglobulin-like domain of bacterial spore germination.
MKIAALIMMICFSACNGGQQDHVTSDTSTKKITAAETARLVKKKITDTIAISKIQPAVNIYSNKRFKNVTVEKTGINKYLVKGTAQIFEATFTWVIEDGHEELQKGFAMTDAGAPEWGKFSFTIEAVKKRANSVLHLILFESSAKDGSHQYELPILLN